MDSTLASPRRRAVLLLIGAWLASSPALALAQSSPEESAKKVKPAEGLEATLWASEPLLFNPTSMDVDSRGRVWVAEGLNYRLTRGGNKRFSRIEESDKIKILEDTDGDGKADKVTVFADRIFPVPMGLAVEERYTPDGKYAGCRVYVGNSPNLLVLEDKDGDDKVDDRYPLLTGFGGLDSDHGVHGMTLGLDGRLYFTHGDGCCSVQEDRSERYQNFDVVDKGGRHVAADKYANTLRVDRDGKNFEVVCDGQRNNYETCLNAFGHGFTSDNDDDGNRGCRVIHTMDGGRFGYKTPGSPRHWGEDVPGNVPKLVGTGNGSPCGISCYEGSLLPASYFGALFEAEAGTRQINAFPLTREGSTFKTEPGVLLASDDPWFRPVDVTAAPDGSVFVADWYDAGVGGHAFADQDTGRIYRVVPKGAKPAQVKLDFGSVAGLVEALKSPCVAAQDAGRRGLIAKGDASAEALNALIHGGTPTEAARAIWTASAMPQHASIGVEMLKNPGAYRGDDPRFRELAVRLLGRDCRENGIVEYQNPEARRPAPALEHLDLLLPLAADPDAGVRRELILALRKLPTPKVADALRKLVVAWDGRDRWYLEALGLALDGREPEFITSLMDPSLFGSSDAGAKSGDDKLALPPYFPVDRNEAFIPAGAPEPDANATSKFLGLLWRLQRPESLPVLEELLPRLKTPALQQAGDDVLRRVKTPYAADVAALMTERIEDPIRRGLLCEMLAEQLAGPWNEAKDRPPVLRVVQRALDDPERRRQGIAMAAATRDARYRASLEQIAADPGQPDDVAAAAVVGIGSLGGTPNRLLDDLIAAVRGKGESTPRAEAAVRTLPKLYDARSRLFEILADRDYPTAIRREALRTAARLAGGGMQLVDLARDGKLPDDLKTEATTTLHGLGDPRVREAAASVLPPPATAGGRPLPPLGELLRREGDAGRGETVFFRDRAESCGSCHRVQGRGRWVGPDLSTIGTKYGKDEMLRSILDPGAAISYNFRAVVLALADGRVLTGLPVEETPQRVAIKTAQGERITVPTAEIEQRRFSDVSLMPENLASTMSDGDLVDLLAFLSMLKKPVSVAGRLSVVSVPAKGGPEPDARGRIDLTKPVGPDAEGRTFTWRRIEADVEGRVDLRPFLSADESTAAVYTPLVSSTEQDAVLVVDATSEVQAWHDGKALELKKVDATSLTAALRLPAGSGSLLIRLKQPAAGPATLAATIVSASPVAFDAEAADAAGR